MWALAVTDRYHRGQVQMLRPLVSMLRLSHSPCRSRAGRLAGSRIPRESDLVRRVRASVGDRRISRVEELLPFMRRGFQSGVLETLSLLLPSLVELVKRMDRLVN